MARGGTSDPWNFAVACLDCNRRKGARRGREFLADPTPEQASKLLEVDRRLNRKRVRWLERQRIKRERKVRRAAGVRKAAQTKRQRLADEEFAYREHVQEILQEKARQRESLGLEPLPPRVDREPRKPGALTPLPAKPDPSFLNPHGGTPLRRRWGKRKEGAPGGG